VLGYFLGARAPVAAKLGEPLQLRLEHSLGTHRP
jgi:hypothetical protein